jgi:hypothetical protein
VRQTIADVDYSKITHWAIESLPIPEIVELYLSTLSIESRKWRNHWAAWELVKKLIKWIMGREISYRAGRRGRDGSRGWGQGGQGRGSRDNKPKTYTASSKAPETKFIPHRIGKEVRQTATYQNVKDYIIQLVQKSFRNGKDVADSIRKMERINMTTKITVRRLSRVSDTDDRATEQEGYDILYKAEIDMYTKRKQELEDNMNKTYSLIYLQHCNKTVQDRIHAHPDFETKIENDRIELLKAIEILINDLVWARYPYASVTEAMTRFMTCRQLENKPLADYVKRLKGNWDSMAQNMGKDFLKDFVKNTKQYADETDTDKQDKMLKGLYAQWTAYMLMKNSDQGNYGLQMTSLTTQFSMGTNQYSKDVMAAVDILTNHRLDKKEPKNDSQRNRNWNNNNTAPTITTQRSFNWEVLKKATCYCCGKKGHYSNKCLEKDKRSKDEWAVKKGAMKHAQAKLEKETKEKMTMTTQAFAEVKQEQ